MNLVASLIVKNEIGRYLQPCIAHLQQFCDQIIVVDDGSMDGTGEWLQDQERVDVVPLPDVSEGFFAGHEGRRRQYLLDFTLNHHPDWVLAIDADEFITDPVALCDYIENSGREVGLLDMEEVWKADDTQLSIRMDGGWRPHACPILWKTSLSGRRGQRLRIADKALACGREPEAIRRYLGKARPTGSSILHLGWAKQSGRQARYERYVTADGGQFHRNSHLDSIMWPDEKIRLEEKLWPPLLERVRRQIVEAAS